MSKLQEEFISLTLIDYSNCDARAKWYKDIGNLSAETSHLVYSGDGLELSGLEFESVIYIFPKCPKCKLRKSYSHILSRAKSSLVVSAYFGICDMCKDKENSKKFRVYRNCDYEELDILSHTFL